MSAEKHATKAPIRRPNATASLNFLESYLPYLLGHASSAMNKDFNRYVQAEGLAPLEWRILATLFDHEPLTVGDLAHKVVALQPGVTKAINQLMERGLVERGYDPDDMRRSLVSITQKGLLVVKPLITRALDHERQLLSDISPGEINALRHILQVLIDRRKSASLLSDA